MILAVLALGLVISAIGAAGMVSPARLMGIVGGGRFQSRTGLSAGVLIRVAAGVLLVLASPESRAPAYLWYLGLLLILAGVVLTFVGLERLRGLVRWATELDVSLLRASCFVTAAFGLSLVWAAV